MRSCSTLLVVVTLALFAEQGNAQNNSPPDSDPPNYTQDAGDSFPTATALPPGTYVGSDGGALAGDGSDDDDCYAVNVPSVYILSVVGEVVSPNAGIEFFIFSPQGEPYSNSVHRQNSNPIYSYRASNFAGGDWVICMSLESTGNNTTIHYNLDVEVIPSSRSENGGSLHATLLQPLMIVILLRLLLGNRAKPSTPLKPA